MRNHSKPSKGNRLDAGTAKSKKAKRTAAKALKKEPVEMTRMEVDVTVPTTGSEANQECIFLDSGSKKSYIDLTKIKTEKDQYPRMSVIRTIVTPANTAFDQYDEFYQEKPVDFSPKNKYKTECSSTAIMDISRNYTTTMVV